jgi:uncharacterized protein DUF5670
VRLRTDAGEGYAYRGASQTEAYTMLYTVAVVLLILWILGLVSSYTLGGLIHILLVVALIVIIVNLLQGRKAL